MGQKGRPKTNSLRMNFLGIRPYGTRLDGYENEDLSELIFTQENTKKTTTGLIILRFIFGLLFLLVILGIFFTVSSVGSNQAIPDRSNHNSFFYDECSSHENWRFDCFPEAGASEAECKIRGCCWRPLEPGSRGPWCFFKVGDSRYNFSGPKVTLNGLEGTAKLVKKSNYPKNVETLIYQAYFISDEIVRVKIVDQDNPKRYEVPFPYPENALKASRKNNSVKYDFKWSQSGFRVYRKGFNYPLVDISFAPLIYSDQFIQFSTSLVSEYVYGIGEAVDNLKRDVNWSRYVLYNHDRIPEANTNNYGSHPFVMNLDEKGNAHGLLLMNSNAMEIELTPAPALTFRTIGGIIDLWIFIGPSPKDVSHQYTSIIGRPTLPPYWGLGFHLCRFNYGTLNHTNAILQSNLDAGIPVDVQWNDLDYMDGGKDFTYDSKNFRGLPDFVNFLHMKGMKYITLIDPGISGSEKKGTYPPYDEGIQMNVFIKNRNGSIFVGKVWNPTNTVWPDFFHENVTKYWMNQLQNFRQKVEIDGAWIDMNEPSNFWNGEATGCPEDSDLNNPPYTPAVNGEKLSYKSICPSAVHGIGKHYDLHNLYGFQETMVTSKVLSDLTGKRPFVISRSTFPGQGRYGGHWTGDVVSSWQDMKQTIPQILSFGLYGIPLVGADICGFNGNTTIELCKRWMQLGALYPFSRNHNTDDGIPQDPASLGEDVVNASKTMLRFRYSVLPYIYSLFFRAHLDGEPVARPLFFEFPHDPNTYQIDDEFMLGQSILVVPILEEGFSSRNMTAYLPAGWWYQRRFSDIIESYGEQRSIYVPKHSIPVLFRGGTIIITQRPGLNTVESRKNPMSIQVYLSHRRSAQGEWFWDDGESNSPLVLVSYCKWSFESVGNTFTIRKEMAGCKVPSLLLERIEIHGVQTNVHTVEIQNQYSEFQLLNKILSIETSLKGRDWTDGLLLKWS